MSEDGLGLGQAFAPGSSKTWSAGSPSGELKTQTRKISSLLRLSSRFDPHLKY